MKKYEQGDHAPDVAKYYAMCEWFDETCGQLLRHLDKVGATENTLVLFICDNGWTATSTNADDPRQQAWPRYAIRSKGSPYENGIRTPILVSWPKRIQPRRTEELAHAIDLYPTIAAATGIDLPSGLAGINLMDDVSRKGRSRVFGVTHSIHNMTLGDPDDTQQYLWCVEREWKLIQRFNGQDTTQYKRVHNWDQAPFRLFHLKRDPGEQHDLAEEHPEEVNRIEALIKQWRKN